MKYINEILETLHSSVKSLDFSYSKEILLKINQVKIKGPEKTHGQCSIIFIVEFEQVLTHRVTNNCFSLTAHKLKFSVKEFLHMNKSTVSCVFAGIY